MEVVLAILCCVIGFLWMRIRAMQWEREADYRYFQWWMSSLENRKQDRPEVVEHEDALLDEDE